MEGTIGEIRMFGGNFAPRTWALCQGQLINISDNVALYTILGVTFGGNGVTTFALPGLSSRVAVGTGQGAGLTNYVLGEAIGTETVTLLSSQIPAHTHTPTFTIDTVTTPSATVTLFGVDTAGGDATPVGEMLGSDGNTSCYAAATGTTVQMDASAVTITSFSGPFPTVAVGVSGGSMPHENLQPYTAVNYVICVEGIFPSRN